MMANIHLPKIMTTLALLTLAVSLLAAAESNDNKVYKPIPPVVIAANHTFSQSDSTWQRTVKRLRAVKVQPGCGRMQNRLVTFEDGSKACARYRLNTNLMQGEIYSYILGKLLGIHNLAPLALTLPDINTEQWSRVAKEVLDANWQSNKLLILTKHISNTEDVFLPQKMKSMQANSVTPGDITASNAETFAQWSDMIVFDYLIGNMDRLVNSLHNKQWNHNVMDMPIHNLAEKDNSFIFFDNEDGLFHGYRILGRYSHLHEQSLKTLCVFRQSTVDSITTLLEADSLEDTITSLVRQTDERVLKYLPKLSSKTVNILHERLRKVAEHIDMCMRRYPG